MFDENDDLFSESGSTSTLLNSPTSEDKRSVTS